MSTNTKVNVDLISVNTKKTQNEFKTLKQRIKELRLELENLDEGTVEYQAKITELGNLIHQNAEIQEQAKLASQDYGDTIASVTKATTGLVASISAVNGVMNLLGVNSDEATKAMLKVQSLMAIVQAMGSLDTAEKSFQSLWTKIKAVTTARKEEAQETIKETATTQANTTAVNQNADALDTQAKTIQSGTSKLKIFGNGIKSLGRSLKSFALSNPFTLIITGITTAISLISTFANKAKQARMDAQDALNANLNQLQQNNANDTQQNTFYNKANAEAYNKELDKLTTKQKELISLQNEIDKKEYKSNKQQIDNQQYKLNILQQELDKEQQRLDLYTEEQKQVEPFLTEYQNYLKDRIKLYQQQFDLEVKTIQNMQAYLVGLRKGSEEYERTLNNIAEAEKRLANIVETDLKNSYATIDSYDKQRDTITKQQNETAQQERDKRQQEQLNKLKDSLSEQKQQLDLDYKNKLITEKDYLDKSLELNKWYENELNKLKGNKYVTKSEKLSAQNNTADSKIKQLEYEILQIRNRIINEPDEILLNEKARLEQNINSLSELIKQNNTKLDDISNKHWIEQYNTLQQQNTLTEEEQIEHLDKMLGIEQSYIEEQQNILRTNYDNRKQYLTDIFNRDNEALQLELEQLQKNEDVNKQYIDEKLNEIAVLEEAHNKQLAELENQYLLNKADIELQKTQLEADYSNQRYEIAKNEVERKIALNETYFNSFQSIQSQLSSFLSEYQNSMDSNSEKYKELQRLQIIMDSASGSYSAFTSVFKSGVPFPYNVILGSIASGLVVGQGVLALNNLNNNKIGTTNAVSNLGNTSTYETLSYQSLNGIETSIRDSRVYVLESDITNVRNRVEIAEIESRF